MRYTVSDLTIDEKIRLLCGRDCWRLHTLDGKIPELNVSDGPSGLRKQKYFDVDGVPTRKTIPGMTAMPTLSVVSNSWNREMSYLDGETIADECIENDSDVLLAPGVNIKRTPLCGRNFEYFSEDPFLAGTMARAYINGVQSKQVGTCLKHYCANNREVERHHQSSEIDERTLREIYLAPFEIALKAKPWSVMCSYNLINGVYAAENRYLLTDVLRGEFGFEGVVISDWRAVRNAARAVKAGLDIEMPGRELAFDDVKAAYEKGWVTEEEIDTLVERILDFIYKADEAKGKRTVTLTKEERHNIAVRVAREGAVLLKNEDNILPLTGGRILVSGLGAASAPQGGGGSSAVSSLFKPKHLGEEIGSRLGEAAEILYDTAVFRYGGKAVRANHTPFVAYDSDYVVFCIGNDSTIEYEDGDRSSLALPKGAEDTLLELIKVNPNVIVVVHAGSAVDMSKWADKVKAILYVGFAGEGANEATADLLCGVVSPSGKLSETFPIHLEDTPTGTEHGNGFVDWYREGVFVGYRYYEKFGVPVLFPFGHGLSYATFEYSNLAISKITETDYEVEFDITNNSSVTASEVAQLYVKDVFSSVIRPVKELKGFEKVELLPGETKRVKIALDERSFAYYNVSLHRWYVENGAFEIHIGSSSKDIRLSGRIDIRLPEEEQATFPVYNPAIVK